MSPHPEDGDPLLAECGAGHEDEIAGDAESGEHAREAAERDRARVGDAVAVGVEQTDQFADRVEEAGVVRIDRSTGRDQQ